jgi:uncharacterized protein (DUF433 family)
MIRGYFFFCSRSARPLIRTPLVLRPKFPQVRTRELCAVCDALMEQCHTDSLRFRHRELQVDGREHKREGMFDRLTFDSLILGGRASIRGMRIPVSVIVGRIAHRACWEEVLAEYPDLETEIFSKRCRTQRGWLRKKSSRRSAIPCCLRDTRIVSLCLVASTY